MNRHNGLLIDRGPLLVALAAAAVGLYLVLAMPPGFFSGDEGVKLIQSRSLLENHWRSPAIPYPGADVDPRARYLPLRPPFVWQHEGSWYGVYSLLYTSVTALAWAAAGLRGVFLVSWLGAAAALLVLARLATRALGAQWATAVVALTAAGSPLLLYGTVNFEHTWAATAVLASLTLLARSHIDGRSCAGAGALLGLGAVIRPELYAFPVGIAAFGVVLWGWRPPTLRRLAWFAAGMGLVTGIDLLSKAVLFGSFHPNLAASDLPPTTYAINLTRLVPPEVGARGLAVLAAALLIGVLPARGRPSTVAKCLAGLVLMMVLAYLTWQGLAAVTPSSRADTRTLIGLFGATPLAMVGLLRGFGSNRERDRSLAAACASAGAAFAATVVAVRIRGFIGGLELGSRYLLPVVPLFLVATADFVRQQRRGWQRAAVVLGCLLLTFVSLRATLANGVATLLIRQDSTELMAAIEESGIDDVVTRHFWIPQLMAPLYFDKRFYLYPDDKLMRRLLKRDHRQVVGVDLLVGVYASDAVEVTRQRILLQPARVLSYRLSPAGSGP